MNRTEYPPLPAEAISSAGPIWSAIRNYYEARVRRMPWQATVSLIDVAVMDQMRAYVDIDRTLRVSADDAKKRWMQIADQRAIEVADLKLEVERLRAQAAPSAVAGCDAEVIQVIKERDAAEDMADQLAAQIADITGEEIGEHTSANDPWHNAMLAADEWIARELRRMISATQPSKSTYKDSTPELSVGESVFERWFSSYNPALKGDKQRARDAYAAGMGDPLVVAAPTVQVAPQQAVPESVEFSQFLSDVVTAAGLLSYGKQSKALANGLLMQQCDTGRHPSRSLTPMPSISQASRSKNWCMTLMT